MMMIFTWNKITGLRRSMIFLLALLLSLSACQTTIEEELSDEAAILSFMLKKSENQGLPKDYTGTIDEPTRTITIVADTDIPLDAVKPSVTLTPGATLSPGTNTAVNLSKPVKYNVTAPSGRTVSYTVTVSLPSKKAVISGLSVNDAICPWDRTSYSFFYPVTEADRAGSKFFCTGEHIAGLLVDGKQVANGGTLALSSLEPGKTITITPLNGEGNQGESVKLTMTSLPLVNISTNHSIVNDPKRECFISLIDPKRRTNDNMLYFPAHRAGIETRGGLAQSFPKKSYAIEFWHPHADEEVEEGTRLLGIRNDGDWILDAMYVDRARMRNRLSMDIWNDMNQVPHIALEPNAVNGTRGYLVEVFLNDAYLGLYTLSDRIDRKQLKLDMAEGLSYKGSHWSSATEFYSGDAAINNSSDTWDGWELRYQGTAHANASPKIRWEPLRDFIRFTATSNNTLFAADLEKKIDIDNLVDYLLFTNMLGADDNTGKNSFFSIYNNAYPKFFITPWDLDATFGRKWNGEAIDLRNGEFIGVTGVPRTDSRYCRPNAFFQRVWTQNPSNFKGKMKARWQVLRNTELSPQNIAHRIEKYKAEMISSGAYARERSRWSGSANEINGEAAFMISWLENRHRQMDDIVNGL